MNVQVNAAGDTWRMEHDGMVDYLDHAPDEAEKRLFMQSAQKHRQRTQFENQLRQNTVARPHDRRSEQDYH